VSEEPEQEDEEVEAEEIETPDFDAIIGKRDEEL